MRLESAQHLKEELLNRIVMPFVNRANRLRRAGATAVSSASTISGAERETIFGVAARPFDTLPRIQRTVALGVARQQGEYRLAVRVQRPSLIASPIVEHLTREAKGEVDVRVIGRVDKRAKRQRTPTVRRTSGRARASAPWYQLDTRPLQIGASVGHVDVTAGTIGAFVKRGKVACILSNNHVLANEDQASVGDWVLQRAAYDGGKQPSERVARLRFWIRLKISGANVVDAALADIQRDVKYDPSTLRGLVHGADKRLAGVGPEFLDEGEFVYKIGRTTGPTEGRVTAFDLDNVIVNYDIGNLRFDGQVEIEGTGRHGFSDGGDSGSLIVNAEMKAVALLFAGGDTGGSNGLGLTYANPVHRVLKDLKASLLF